MQQFWQRLRPALREMGRAAMARRNGLTLPLTGAIATVVSAAPGGPSPSSALLAGAAAKLSVAGYKFTTAIGSDGTT